jgi:hypothetical protein
LPKSNYLLIYLIITKYLIFFNPIFNLKCALGIQRTVGFVIGLLEFRIVYRLKHIVSGSWSKHIKRNKQKRILSGLTKAKRARQSFLSLSLSLSLDSFFSHTLSVVQQGN